MRYLSFYTGRNPRIRGHRTKLGAMLRAYMIGGDYASTRDYVRWNPVTAAVLNLRGI